jgi:hypothetical protein
MQPLAVSDQNFLTPFTPDTVSLFLFHNPKAGHHVINLIGGDADVFALSRALSDCVGRLDPSCAPAGASIA